MFNGLDIGVTEKKMVTTNKYFFIRIFRGIEGLYGRRVFSETGAVMPMGEEPIH